MSYSWRANSNGVCVLTAEIWQAKQRWVFEQLDVLLSDWVDTVHVSAFSPIRIGVNETIRFDSDATNNCPAIVLTARYIVSPRRHIIDNIL